MLFFITNAMMRSFCFNDGDERQQRMSDSQVKSRLSRPISAQGFLASCVGDINLLFDWLFWLDNKDNNAVPSELNDLVFFFAVIGTCTWLNFVTHSFLWAIPLDMCIDMYASPIAICASSLWTSVAAEIFLNDVPMLCLSIAVDSAKAGEFSTCGEVTILAALNITTSILDISSKVAEAIDSYISFEKKLHEPSVAPGKIGKPVAV